MGTLLPHGFCINWSPSLLWINVVSNAIVALAYFSIPGVLGYIAYKRKDFNLRPALILFSAFIIACGVTHLMAIIMIWRPVYVLDNAIMVVTAALSLGTALYLLPQMPRILSIPSNAQLADLNNRLQAEIERKHQFEKILSEKETHYRALAENSPDIIVRYDRQGRRLYVNQAYEMVTGIPISQVLGKTVLDNSMLKGSIAQQYMDNILAIFNSKKETCYELSFDINERTHHYQYRCIPELDENNKVQSVLAVGRDVTAYKEMELQLQSLAKTDVLTGIANRRSFMELLTTELALVKRHQSPACLLLIDMDHFKHINDAYGHACGDEALKLLVNLILTNLRTSDVFGRVGGEEFAIILHQTSFNDGLEIAEKLRNVVANSILNLKQVELKFTISIGVSDLRKNDEDTSIPLRRADHALYEAKRKGRNQVVASLA